MQNLKFIIDIAPKNTYRFDAGTIRAQLPTQPPAVGLVVTERIQNADLSR